MQYKLYPSRFPQTIKALAKVVETRIAFAIRRVQWTAGYFFNHHTLPSRRQLILRAGVANRDKDVPEIKKAIDEAWLSLQQLHTTMTADAA
jgi:hypothetical protein